MKIVSLALLSAGLAVAGPAAAQTLEESYAKLCAGANKGSESCQVLRKALQEKLADEDAPTAVDQPVARAVAAKKMAPADAAKWGFWATLSGTTQHAPGSIVTYGWREPNRVMELRDEVGGTVTTLALREDGALQMSTPNAPPMTPDGNGGFTQTDPAGQWRIRSSLTPEGVKTIIETRKDGAWTPASESLMRPLSAQELADARSALQDAASPENIRANWGLYAQLVGRTWIHKLYETRYVWTYEWIVPGVSMSRRFAAMTKDQVSSPPTPRAAAIMLDPITRKLSQGVAHPQPDGTLLLDMGTMRTTTRLRDGDSYEEVTEEQKNGRWKHLITARHRMAGGPDMESILASLSAPKSSSGGGGGGGGLFGAVLGATMGAAMGGNTEQVVGAAIKGVQLVDPNNQVGQAFGSQADAMVSGQGLNAQSMLAGQTGLGGAAGGASGGGSYPTKPNLASGLCPGFSEANYRTVALQSGGDMQVKSFCGQAFEYYTMYRRAIAQGYSEADSNRTYAAHEGTVQQLRNFVGQ